MSSLGPETLYTFRGINITNTLASTVLTDVVLLLTIFATRLNLSIIPGKIQSIIETIIEYFYTLCEQLAGERTKSIFPWVVSFFLFIFVSNILGLVPGFGSIKVVSGAGHGEFIPLFRTTTSDFNTTFALAVISLVVTHVLSIKYTGIVSYFSRFLSLNPIFLFVGLLEIISEITKLFSLSFRLFGNIYAGEVVLTTVSSIFAFVAPIPFLLLETVVALVQALVFSMLTLVFMSILTSPLHSEGGEH